MLVPLRSTQIASARFLLQQLQHASAVESVEKGTPFQNNHFLDEIIRGGSSYILIMSFSGTLKKIFFREMTFSTDSLFAICAFIQIHRFVPKSIKKMW